MTSPDTVTCKLCRRQFSKYTCPICNVPYCSLTCFRSPSHSQCSETFYKKQVESDIRAEPSKSAQERQRMLELLKRFEEESLDAEEEDEEESDLARRMQDVDLESSDQLWALLTPDEREKFLKVMENPSSELAQQLLASQELENEKQDPWWDSDSSSPEPIQVPPSLSSPNGGPSLIYNICAVFVTYAYTTRHLSISPLSTALESDAEAARFLISQLTPFLTSRTSKTLHRTLDDALTELHSRLPPDSATPQLLALLLRDAASLLRPPLVADESTGPHARALGALGDLHVLFQTRAHVGHKLTFYAAQLPTIARQAALELDLNAKVREADSVSEGVEWERVEAAERRRIVELSPENVQ
ncbi:hypothetical protein FB45DRAFT_41847 [Roridomyces roridus]|uniref:HIT-type domain-containing protein n=1 Tax=Roridomyces roridus TaxID=1738132 RepID=A0AAD7BRC3_9AGAR|nr:hypothetical protein FB45DRAFT_41847 [Roridomyces roridus]